MKMLETKTGISGYDAYCHVCWEPAYVLWASKESPNNKECSQGDFDAVSCPFSRAKNSLFKDVFDLRDEGLLPAIKRAHA